MSRRGALREQLGPLTRSTRAEFMPAVCEHALAHSKSQWAHTPDGIVLTHVLVMKTDAACLGPVYATAHVAHIMFWAVCSGGLWHIDIWAAPLDVLTGGINTWVAATYDSLHLAI